MKEYKVNIIEEYDDYLGMTTYQEVVGPKEESLYSVCSLEDCPEDAIIGRCLVDAFGYIDILNAGIKLAKQGYDKVIYTCYNE